MQLPFSNEEKDLTQYCLTSRKRPPRLEIVCAHLRKIDCSE